MNWIKITEKLPELDQDVLLLDDWAALDENVRRKDIRIGYLKLYTTVKSNTGITNICEWGGGGYYFNITHWMPLPELPKE